MRCAIKFVLAITLATSLLSGCKPQGTSSCCQSQKSASAPLSERWWPRQAAPKIVYRTVSHEHFEPQESPGGRKTAGHMGTTHIMIQSLAGLAARAVNEGRCDAMIWITVGHPQYPLNPDYAMYYQDIKNRLGFEERGPLPSWDLVKIFKDKGVVSRYVLYRYDFSKGHPYEERPDADMSVNAATMAAAAEGALLIEEGQQRQAEALGLRLAVDARDMSVKEAFERYKDRLRRDFVASLDPKVGHNREFVLAYPCPVSIGMDETFEAMLQWAKPLSPIVGYMWNEEGKHTRMVSRWGHFNTATNWMINMPMLIAASQREPDYKAAGVDPRQIDFDHIEYAVAFAITDGDNMNWLVGDFYNNPLYWAHPHRNAFPFSWTSCFVNLGQVAAPTVDALLRTKPVGDSFIEYGAGYQFPDAFGASRPNRRELLAEFAQRAWQRMQRHNINVFGFLCDDFHSPQLREAVEIYAQHMPGLAGMIAVQYYPYEGGPDDVIWVKNADGAEIPVARAAFALWSNYSSPFGGSPARVARLVNETVAKAKSDGKKSFNWVVVHAWSGFKKSESDDEIAEYGQFMAPDSHTGVAPTKWTIERLDKSIKVVSIEELLWLMRMNRNPRQTQQIIQQITR